MEPSREALRTLLPHTVTASTDPACPLSSDTHRSTLHWSRLGPDPVRCATTDWSSGSPIESPTAQHMPLSSSHPHRSASTLTTSRKKSRDIRGNLMCLSMSTPRRPHASSDASTPCRSAPHRCSSPHPSMSTSEPSAMPCAHVQMWASGRREEILRGDEPAAIQVKKLRYVASSLLLVRRSSPSRPSITSAWRPRKPGELEMRSKWRRANCVQCSSRRGSPQSMEHCNSALHVSTDSIRHAASSTTSCRVRTSRRSPRRASLTRSSTPLHSGTRPV
mmetsp:Transcript_11059/g.27110  ORF Transcript_11059/g.27110 Transcript_11059/m.27110 type:complete len:276 (-) Transcript_11059:454-1281(-)